MEPERIAVTPSGRLLLAGDAKPELRRAFESGTGHGLLVLAGLEPDEPSLAYFRAFGRRFLTALAHIEALEAQRKKLSVAPPAPEELAELAARAPPMDGGEMLDTAMLGALWSELESAAKDELARWRGTAEEWLHARAPELGVVGRVVLHLAENKNDEDYPFAFLATYAVGVSRTGAVKHAPLGRALEEYGGARNRQALLRLLAPIQRAAEASPFVRALVDSGDVYHPLAWTAEQAHAFLRAVPDLETSGVVTRVPDWWNPRRPPRPVVNATIGRAGPSRVGLEALLDFSVTVALDGQPLTQRELEAALEGSEGLVRLKGRWVEIDRERLSQALAHWKHAEQAARQGVSFFEAMRLISGAHIDASAASGDAAKAPPEWFEVAAGPWLADRLRELRDPAHAEAADPSRAVRATLRPYQIAGVQWLRTLHALGLGGCLADDMGLGKTLQILALLALAKRSGEKRPSLVVAPASLLANWRAEAERFAPDLGVVVAHPSALPAAELEKQPLNGGTLVVTSYGFLGKSKWFCERDWNVVALDEAQAIKNPSTRQARATKDLRARCRIALTGTPIENRLADLWSIYDFACPGLLGSSKRFAGFVKTLESKKSADGHAPLRRLIAPYLLRRLKTDKSVIRDLPDKTELIAYCPLSRKQAELYQRVVDDLARELKAAAGMKRRGIVLSSLLQLKQICNHPSQWLGDGAWDPSASGKLGRLRELCEPIAARQDKLLVFTQFRELTRPLGEFLGGVFGREGLVLDGSTAVRRRAELVNRFQDDLGPPFFVISLKAGGSGLNLTRASHVVHFDRWWNPAVENQATDRAFRIGQQKNVFVHKLVCRGTVEERISKMIEDKQELAKSVLTAGAETQLTELGDAELLRVIALDMAAALERE